LSGGDLALFIDSIAGEMPHLHQVTLLGMNNLRYRHNAKDDSANSNQEERDRGNLRHAVESFVLGIGPRPLWNAYLEPDRAQSRNYANFERSSDKAYEYEQPILCEDQAMQDDPEWDYAWDQFDDRMFNRRVRC
jgi:hypothetical protein